MARWRRRIRGAVGMGVVWGLAWFGAGMALLLVVGPDAADVPFPLGFGAFGFLAGGIFSGVLGLAAGRRGFEELSVLGFAGWGGVGGLVLGALLFGAAALTGDATPDLWVASPVFGLASAGSAAGSLVLARRAGEGRRLEGGGEGAGIEAGS